METSVGLSWQAPLARAEARPVGWRDAGGARGSPTRAALVPLAVLAVLAAGARGQQPRPPVDVDAGESPSVFVDAGDRPLPSGWPGRDGTALAPTAADAPVLLWLLRDDHALEQRFAEPDLRPTPEGAWLCLRAPELLLAPGDDRRLLATRGALPIAALTDEDPADWLAAVLDGSVVQPDIPTTRERAQRFGLAEWTQFHRGVIGLVALGRLDEALAALEQSWPVSRGGSWAPYMLAPRELVFDDLWALLMRAAPRATSALLTNWIAQRSDELADGLRGGEDVAAFGEVLFLCRHLGSAAPLARLVRRMPAGLCGDVAAAATQASRADLLALVLDGAFDQLTGEGFDAEALAAVGSVVPYVHQRVQQLGQRAEQESHPTQAPPVVLELATGLARQARPGMADAIVAKALQPKRGAVSWMIGEQSRVAHAGLRVLLAARRMGQAGALADRLGSVLGDRLPLLVLRACRDLDLRVAFTDEWAARLPAAPGPLDDPEQWNAVRAWLAAGD